MAALRALYLRQALFERPRPPRRLVDHSNPLEALTEEKVRQKFRFRPCTILYIVDLVQATIKRKTNQNHALPPLIQVLICLRFLACGTFYAVIADGWPRVAKSTVCRAVVGALLAYLDTYIKFPSDNELARVKQEFYSIAGFPNVIGVIDGTQVPITAPSHNENDFVNRKGFHSINCQMICDAKLKFLNVVAKWPGSVHDARILRESRIGRELQAGIHKGMLLGDSGYPCRRYCMVPYPNPAHGHQERFNRALCRTRVLIEQSFGVLKRRFACLKMLRVEPTKACKIICVTTILHNIAIDHNDDVAPLEMRVMNLFMGVTTDWRGSYLETELQMNISKVQLNLYCTPTHHALQ